MYDPSQVWRWMPQVPKPHAVERQSCAATPSPSLLCLHVHHRADSAHSTHDFVPSLFANLSLKMLTDILRTGKKKKNNGLVSVLACSVSFVPLGISSKANPTLDWLRRREANQYLIALPLSLISHRINFYGKSYGSLKCKGSYEAAYIPQTSVELKTNKWSCISVF